MDHSDGGSSTVQRDINAIPSYPLLTNRMNEAIKAFQNDGVEYGYYIFRTKRDCGRFFAGELIRGTRDNMRFANLPRYYNEFKNRKAFLHVHPFGVDPSVSDKRFAKSLNVLMIIVNSNREISYGK